MQIIFVFLAPMLLKQPLINQKKKLNELEILY